MHDIIAVNLRHIGDTETHTTSARDLHAFLEVGKVFGAWIQERIEQYEFEQGKDYEVFSESGNNPAGGRPAKEYAITLDMAKELAMVERNEKGRQARKYFIECEKRLKAQTSQFKSLPSPLQDKVSALLALGDFIANVPGIRPGMAAAATLYCVSKNTGLDTEDFRKALPASENVHTLNATQVGKLLGISARAANTKLSEAGLQEKSQRGDWVLTAAGARFAEAIPFENNGHAGYQILWNPKVADQLKAAA